MRLLEYIQGELFPHKLIDKTDYLDLDNEALEIVSKECSKIIKTCINAGGFIYRGLRITDRLKEIGENIYMVTPRKNRKPKDTTEELHTLVDISFKKRFGWNARSEGIFCTGSIKEALDYGNTIGIIFPVDGFKYLWSHKIRDLYSDQLQNIYDEVDSEYFDKYGGTFTKGHWENEATGEKKHWKSENEIEQSIVFPIDHIEEFIYTDPRMIVIHLKNGTKIAYNWIPAIEFDEFRDNALKNKCDRITSMYTDKNLIGAIKKGNEIMIKCDYYYFIETTRNELKLEDLNL